MARILLGWELGAGTGHAVKLAKITRLLRDRGHEPVLAVQQIGSAPAGVAIWQAPLWPGQLTTLARRPVIRPATFGDILAVLGLGDEAAFGAMLGGWSRIIAAVRPDAVIAEYAPALMLAARGRVPVVALGTGFSLPPAHLDHFPSLTGEPATMSEAVLLRSVNRALAGIGQPRIDTLPALLAADVRQAAAFTELDPYREWRIEPLASPSIAANLPASDGTGDELFIYMNGLTARAAAFWQGLADSGLPVRVHDPMLKDGDRAALERAGLTVETRPVPFDRIVARSRMVMSHCGLGLTCSALVSGMPHILVPHDIEKRMTADSVVALGLGARVDFDETDSVALAAYLRVTFADDALVARARTAAPGFRARLAGTSEQQAVDAAERLLG